MEIELGSTSITSAVHRCRHTSREAIIGWRVNGSLLGQFPDITTGSINENGALVYTLTIPARSEYNGTVVVCVALFTDGTPSESTPPATVIFSAGVLESVPECTITENNNPCSTLPSY